MPRLPLLIFTLLVSAATATTKFTLIDQALVDQAHLAAAMLRVHASFKHAVGPCSGVDEKTLSRMQGITEGDNGTVATIYANNAVFEYFYLAMTEWIAEVEARLNLVSRTDIELSVQSSAARELIKRYRLHGEAVMEFIEDQIGNDFVPKLESAGGHRDSKIPDRYFAV